MSKQFHVGLGVFVAVWNVAASILFGFSLVSEYTVGAVFGLFGLPFLVVGGAGHGIQIPYGPGMDEHQTIGLGQFLVGTGVVVSMTAPVVLGSTDRTDLLVAALALLAGGTVAAMGGAVATGILGLPGAD